MESRIVPGSRPMSTITVEEREIRVFSKGKIMVELANLGLWEGIKQTLSESEIGGIPGWDAWTCFLTFKDGDPFFEEGKKRFIESTGMDKDKVEELLNRCIAE